MLRHVEYAIYIYIDIYKYYYYNYIFRTYFQGTGEIMLNKLFSPTRARNAVRVCVCVYGVIENSLSTRKPF